MKNPNDQKALTGLASKPLQGFRGGRGGAPTWGRAPHYQIPSKSQNLNPKKGEEKIYDIRERVFSFAQRILEIAEKLPQNRVCDVLRAQLVKSGTSIGANVEEADGAVTKRDFINKIAIARKEAKETKYWLRLIAGKYIKAELLEEDIMEVQEIINILSAIINKTKGE